ncbi:MAG: hypothetical protein AAB574_01080 [Patescibacteria group bacterium]
MSDFEKFNEEEYRRKTLAEIRAEMARNGHRSLEGLKIVDFLSRSNGHGRKPRRWPREVILLRYDQTTYQVKSGEIVPRKSGGLAPDVVANEALAFLPPEERSVDNLLVYARNKVK